MGKWRCLLEAPVIQKVPFRQVKPLGITNRASKLAVDSYKGCDRAKQGAVGPWACGEEKERSPS